MLRRPGRRPWWRAVGLAGTPAALPNGAQRSPAGAQAVAGQHPRHAEQITAAPRSAFLAGAQVRYLAGTLAVLAGGALVYFLFPKRDAERAMLAECHAQDLASAPAAARGGA